MLLRSMAVLVLLFAAAACADDDVEDSTPPIDELDTPDDEQDAGVDDAVPPDVGSTEGPCGWLTPDEISDATGLAVVTATPESGGCTWDVTDEAAVIAGPNEGEEAELRVTEIDQTAFGAARGPGSDVEPVDGVGDAAFVAVEADESETTIFVRRDSSYFSLNLAGGLDDRNANRSALTELSSLIAQRLS